MNTDTQERKASTQNKKFTLITGASKGIGKAFAIECARLGHNLALVALPGEELEDLSLLLAKDYQIAVQWKETDLSLQDSPQEVYDWTVNNGIDVNVLINNAGFGSLGSFDDHSLAFYDTMINVNVKTPVALTRLFLPHLKAEPKAYILNVGSAASFFPVPKKIIYSCTKAFVLFLSRALGEELKDTNIQVTAVCPNGVPTNEITRARIDQLGWKGKLAAVEPDELARYSMVKMTKGKKVIIPGRVNRISLWFSWLMPTGFSMRFMDKQLSKEVDEAAKQTTAQVDRASQQVR